MNKIISILSCILLLLTFVGGNEGFYNYAIKGGVFYYTSITGALAIMLSCVLFNAMCFMGFILARQIFKYK